MKTLINKSSPWLIPVACILILSCNNREQKKEANSDTKVAICFDTKGLDTSIKAGDDFYEYVNGIWSKNNPIPSTESKWGSFSEIDQRNEKALHEILEAAANNGTAIKGSTEQKIGDYYYSVMDSVKRNKDGFNPIKEELTSIDSLQNNEEIQGVLAKYARYGIFPLWSVYVTQDSKNSEVMALHFGQSGLGLPDRDFYTKTDIETKKIQQAYISHIKKIYVLLGETEKEAEVHALKVMDIETQLAKVHRTNIEERKVEKLYNKLDVAGLSKLAPSIKWSSYFDKIGATDLKNVIVREPEFITASEKTLKSIPLNDWKVYLRWKLVDKAAASLSEDFETANFNFYYGVLNGVKEMEPRWKRAIHSVDGALGEALGEKYVAKYFTEESKKKVKTMVDNLIAAYKERINAVDWMNDSTKAKAQEKLNSVMVKVGYPDKWIDYSTLEVSRESYFKNQLNATAFHFNKMMNKLGKPVDRTEWGMSPPTVNAYYNPSMNEIVFPAGIMQPPFFNPDADDALNYGSMGAIIGHELTHGFDDEGNKFDAKGNMLNWWTAQDKKQFEKRTTKIVEQFNGFVAIDTMHVNGELTLGENIADLGGLTISYAALQKSFNGVIPEKIDGFTANQRFFLAWAQAWRINFRDEALKQQVLTNPHSPGKFRCNGPLTNMPEFYAAFGIQKGDKMYKEESERAKIW